MSTASVVETPSSSEPAAPASPAGPIENPGPARMPPLRAQRRIVQTVRFVLDPLENSLEARRRHGDVWQVLLVSRKEPFVVTAHPDHVASLFKAKPGDAPSLTGES